MNQIKISPEIKIDTAESQLSSGDTVKETSEELPKKNSFEEVLKKISELRKGKAFATPNEVSKFHSQLIEKKESEIEQLISNEENHNLENIPINNEEGAEEGLAKKNNILEVENEINSELQSILLGPNTQIITAKEIESNTKQLVAYAKKAGLNENAISILLKGTAKKDFSPKEAKSNKNDPITSVESLGQSTMVKKQFKSNTVKVSLTKHTLFKDLNLDKNSKSKPTFEKTSIAQPPKTLEIERWVTQLMLIR